MTDTRPVSQQFFEASNEYVELNKAANMLEEAKSAVLSRWMTDCGDIAVSKAEMMVKASTRWQAYLDRMCEARYKADKAKVKVDYLRMTFSEWQSKEANARVEARL